MPEYTSNNSFERKNEAPLLRIN